MNYLYNWFGTVTDAVMKLKCLAMADVHLSHQTAAGLVLFLHALFEDILAFLFLNQVMCFMSTVYPSF